MYRNSTLFATCNVPGVLPEDRERWFSDGESIRATLTEGYGGMGHKQLFPEGDPEIAVISRSPAVVRSISRSSLQKQIKTKNSGNKYSETGQSESNLSVLSGACTGILHFLRPEASRKPCQTVCRNGSPTENPGVHFRHFPYQKRVENPLFLRHGFMTDCIPCRNSRQNNRFRYP